MPFLKRSLVAAAVAAALTLATHYAVRASHLKEANRLREANDRIRFEISQRRQAQVRNKSVPSPVPAPTHAAPGELNGVSSNREATEGPLNGTKREQTGDYRREGQDTPVAALQSFAWACDHGDLATMQQLIVFDAAARTKAAAYLASLPANVRAQWSSPEAMAAAMLVADGIDHPYPIAGILAQAKTEALSAERVVLHLPDTGLREHSEYQKMSEGWKYVITEEMVDRYLRRAAQRAAAK